jgi:hypothetical protein
MNFLCQSCQQMLTVPEQYAGQLMKCPLCGATFTVPALPQTPGTLPAAAPPPAPPSAALPAGYGLAAEPQPATVGPAPAPQPAAPSRSVAEPPQPAPTSPPPPPPPAVAGHTHTFSVPLSARVIPWVAPVALLLVFVLTFFDWVGVYAGDEALYTQSAWRVTFGGVSTSDAAENTKSFFPGYGAVRTAREFAPQKEDRPGISFLMFLWVFLLLVSLLVAVAAAGWPFVAASLPPVVAQVQPWRWALVTGVSLLAFVLLLGNLVLGFKLEDTMAAYFEKEAEAERSRAVIVDPDTQKRRSDAPDEVFRLRKERNNATVERTDWLSLAVFLGFVAPAAAGLAFWLEQRGSRPEPRLDVHV